MDNGMRNNTPTDTGDFGVALPPTDDTPATQKITKEQRELSKIGNSADWKIITSYLNARIEVYKNGLFGEDLRKQSTEIIGQRFLAAQSVIQEFEALKTEVDQVTEIVNAAVGKDNLDIAKDKV